MSLKSRLPKINQVADDPKTYETSNLKATRNGIKGIVKSWMVYSIGETETVPGVTYNKPHNVEVFWHYENGVKVGDVKLYTYDPADMGDKYGLHKANDSRYTLCYQILGAMKFAAKKAGKSISFCDSEQKAKKLLNFGGEMIVLRVAGGGTVWAVVRDIKSIDKDERFKSNRKESFNDRVILLRLAVEARWGID